MQQNRIMHRQIDVYDFMGGRFVEKKTCDNDRSHGNVVAGVMFF